MTPEQQKRLGQIKARYAAASPAMDGSENASDINRLREFNRHMRDDCPWMLSLLEKKA